MPNFPQKSPHRKESNTSLRNGIIMLRKLKEKDIPIVVKLHTDYIPGAFFPKLGHEFMTELYKGITRSQCAVTYVWEDSAEEIDSSVKKIAGISGKPVAFITATTDASELLKTVLKQNMGSFIWKTFIYLLGNPMGITEIFETLGYSKKAEVPGVSGEFLFIAMDKNYRGRNISDKLVKKCMEWLKNKGLKKVKVSTYTNNKGANALLERLGFKVDREIKFRGKMKNLYVGDL